MKNEHERTFRMKEAYKKLHDEGYSPQEIADKFHLSVSTVYNTLQEIAEAEGVTRDSLLVSPRNTPAAHDRKFVPVEPLNIEELVVDTAQVIEKSEKVSATIEKYLTDQEGEERE